MSESEIAQSSIANTDNNANEITSSLSTTEVGGLKANDEEGKRRNDESKVKEFKEITGVTDDDLATRYLNNHDFDVESAVLTYFASSLSNSSSSSSSSSSFDQNNSNIQQQEEIFNRYQPAATASTANITSNNPVRRTPSPTPSISNQDNLFQDQSTSSSVSNNNNNNNRGGIIDSISSAVLWPLRLLSGAQVQSGDETSDARKFVESFERKYYHESREEVHINFLPISYKNALLQAARERKPLFVYFHCNDHPNTDAFCREVLASADVCNTVNNSMIAWGGDIDYKDAYQAAFSFQVGEFPFIAILMVNSVGQTQQQRFASARIIDKVEGYESSHMFLTRIRQAMQQTAHAAAAQARAQREATERARLLEEQQNELRQAVEEDRRREEEERRKEEELKQQELEEERRLKFEEEAREKEKKELIENIENKRRSLLEEPDESDKNAFTIRFQLPEGTKLSVSYVKF